METFLQSQHPSDSQCRICLQSNIDRVSLFDSLDSIKLFERVMFCTSVIIEKGDNLPEFICKNCLSELEVAEQFKRKSEYSDLILREKCLQTMCEVEYASSKEDNLNENSFHSESASDEDHKPLTLLFQAKKSNKKSLHKQTKNVKQIKETINKIAESPENLEGVQSDLNSFEIGTNSTINVASGDVKKQKKFNRNANSKRASEFKCETCQLNCQSKWILKVHMRTHSGERPYQCDVCLKRFVSNSNMRMHKRLTHEEEKQVTCKCKHSCKTLTFEYRTELLTGFHYIDEKANQDAYLMGLMDISPVKRRRNGKYEDPAKSRRQCSIRYMVPDEECNFLDVCRSTFMEIFGLTSKKLQLLTEKKKFEMSSVPHNFEIN